MFRFLRRLLPAIPLACFAVAAQAQCPPVNVFPFVTGCPLPAAELNAAINARMAVDGANSLKPTALNSILGPVGSADTTGNLTLLKTLKLAAITGTGNQCLHAGTTGLVSGTGFDCISTNLLATGVQTWLGTPTSANLLAAMTNETGTGLLVFNTSPALTTPTITDPVLAGKTNAVTVGSVTGATDNATLNVDAAVFGANAAKFGPTRPMYILGDTPTLGFNLYWNGTAWAYGKASVSSYAGYYRFEVTSGMHHWASTTAAGNAGVVATSQEVFAINKDGVVAIGAGAAFTSAFPALRRNGVYLEAVKGDQSTYTAFNTSLLSSYGDVNISSNGRVVTYPSSRPTISACGVGASVTGNDTAGVFLVGTSAITSCTVTFARPFIGYPTCIVSPYHNLLSVNIAVATSQTNFTVIGGNLTGGYIYYMCADNT